MAENIISLLNKLSFHIVSEEFENRQTNNWLAKNEKNFERCVRRLRQKGCDVLLNKECIEPLEDPCMTEYGGNWSPFIMLSDYEKELQNKKSGKYSEILHSSLETLQDKDYDYVNELLKFLLLLKRSFVEISFQNQNETAFGGSDFLSSMLDSFSYQTIDFTSDGLRSSMSNKKGLHYEESWTKNFDGGFELLGEYSKRNLHCSDRGSLNSLFTWKLIPNKIQSQSVVLTDFFSSKNPRQRSLMQVCTNSEDNALLDKLVDNPITHKLPDMNFQSRYSIRSGFLERLSDEPDRKKSTFQRNKSQITNLCDTSSSVSNKTSVIELKRNSNCCHSFSILYEKSRNSQESNCCYDEFMQTSTQKSLDSGSRGIIIGLWEEQHELLKEFKPELEKCFPKLRMISMAEYIEDVKYLFTGINNGTFNLDTKGKRFNMIYGTCLQDVTPESLYDFSKDFLDIGNSYVKLLARVTEIGKNNFDVCKTVSQAFWKSIFDYLELHYALVLDISSDINLMALKFSTMDMREMIVTIAEICKVWQPCEAFPEDGQLLNYLLHIAEKLSKNSVQTLVFGIIRNCCRVYFMCVLQTWMFQGSVDSENSEFFVSYKRPKIKTRTRCYYNSFYVISKKVPVFLEGLEESIFNCGKSIHFLKLFNIEDKFCQLLDKTDYPSMYPCFTKEDLDKLKTEFEDYEKRVLDACGSPVSVKAIREEEKEKEKQYLEFIKESKQKDFERREQARRKAAEEIKARKMEQTRHLNQCWKEIREEKKRKKEAAKLQAEKAEAKMQTKLKETEKMLEEEAAVIKNYYDKRLEALEKSLSLAEARKKGLKEILRNLENNSTELLDNTIQLDAENNITDLHKDQPKEMEEEIAAVVGKELNDNSNADMANVEGIDVENNIVVDVNRNMDQPAEVQKVEMENSSNDSIFYDVNSNPSLTSCRNVKSEMRKSVSYQSTAAEEAKRNKLKVLRSEFDLQIPMAKPSFTETISRETMTDFDSNSVKMQSSDYSVLTLSKFIKEPTVLKMPSSPSLSTDVALQTISLRRKNEYINLKGLIESSDKVTIQAVSLGSLQSQDTSEENVGLVETPAQSSIILNEKYQMALARDAEISQRRMAQQNIFSNEEKNEFTKLPRHDFMQFQRYLKKSVLIPLKIQEKLANDALLKQLLKSENLLSHLNSLRGYFFLNDGEFGRSFTHHTFRSLAKCTEPSQFFERSNLSNIVNEALNYTIHNDEPNAQNLSFQIIKMPPFLNHASHDVLSPFELSYKADWPLNIILTEKALCKYKMVFRFLLKLKRINWTLNENYLHLNSYFKTKKLDGKWFRSSHYHKIQIYRHAMTQIMITLDDYIFSNGIQYPWICFQKDLETTENIDHLYQKHVRYMKDVLTRCFLSKDSEDLLDCLHNLIEIALKFHYTTKSSNFELVDGKLSHPKYKVLKLTFAEFCSVIKTFLRLLKEKISTNQVTNSHYVLIEKFDLKLA